MRPAVALSNADFNADNGQTILAMITTGARSSWPSDMPIADLAAAGLSHASVVRLKLFTLPNQLLLKQTGRLSRTDQKQLGTRVARSLL